MIFNNDCTPFAENLKPNSKEALRLEALLDDRVSGLHRLSEVTYKFKSRMDFDVFKSEKGSWSFHDIMGTIIRQGLRDANMLHDAITIYPQQASL